MAKKVVASADASSSVVSIQPRGLDIKTAAKYIGATVWFMRSLIWERRIPFLKFGNKYVFDTRDLDEFIMSQKTGVR